MAALAQGAQKEYGAASGGETSPKRSKWIWLRKILDAKVPPGRRKVTPLQRRKGAQRSRGSLKAHYEWVLQEFSAMESKDDGSIALTVAVQGDDGGERRLGKEIVVKKGDFALYNDTHAGDHVDLSNMDDLHEAPLVDVLRRRFAKNYIYTCAGDAVVSINPFQSIDGLYDFTIAPSKPHLFWLTRRARENLFEEGKDQIILVNGASGAGKTEATKLMIRHLVWMSGRTAIVDDVGSSVTDKIQDVILSSNAAFEAFGNAFTVHNKNSSRFGKFIRLEYGTKDKAITSAHVSQFLLEKSRLVSPVNGEGNFHILYQIVQQSDDDMFHKLRLGSRDYRDFAFLRGCDDVERPPLEETKEALVKLGYDTTAVLRILSGILHLGEFQFEPKNGDDEVAAVASAGSLLQDVAHLLDLPGNVEDAAATLQKALTVRTTVVGNALPGRRMSIQTMPMTPMQAAESRNGLAKWLYGAIFDGLFEAFNDACGSTSSNLPFIGFLDIFGFEVLAVNSFEQLCINYSNEAMQAFYNEHVFNNEVAVYKAEGVDFSEVRFYDNSELLSLLDGKRDSVFVYLDEQTMLGKRGSDANLLSNLIRRHRSSSATPCFELP
eukprot:g1592.t1